MLKLAAAVLASCASGAAIAAAAVLGTGDWRLEHPELAWVIFVVIASTVAISGTATAARSYWQAITAAQYRDAHHFSQRLREQISRLCDVGFGHLPVVDAARNASVLEVCCDGPVVDAEFERDTR